MAKKRKTAAQKKVEEAKRQSRAYLKNPRQVFNKDLLMFHTKGDYSEHWNAVSEKTPSKDVLFRSLKHLQKKSVKTYADFIAFRVDCLVPDSESDNESVNIAASILRAKDVLSGLKDQLKELGLEAPDSLFKLDVRDRTKKTPRTNKRKLKKIDRLKDLFKSSGMELKQVSLFDD